MSERDQDPLSPYAEIDISTTDFGTILSNLSVLETISRRYRGKFRMPRILLPSLALLYKPSTPGLEIQRTPSVVSFKDGLSTGAYSDVWTPASGKKFRLMGFMVTLSKDAASAGGVELALRDGSSAAFWAATVSSGALAAIGQTQIFSVNLPGNGLLSAAVNNKLQLTTNSDLTAGSATVDYWGTEE